MSDTVVLPKYLHDFELQLRRMSVQVDRKRVWITTNCGIVGDGMIGVAVATSELMRSAAALDKELYRRRYAKTAPFPAKVKS